MNRSLRQDFADAEFLNSRLVVPSTCFRLTQIPKEIKYICCNKDVFSMQIAEQIKTALEMKNVCLQVIVSDDFAVLVSSNPNCKEWNRFERRFNDCKADAKEFLFVAKRTFVSSKKNQRWFEKAYFAIVESFKSNEMNPESFLLCANEKRGRRYLKNADFVICYDDDVVSAYHAVRLWWQLYSTYGYQGPSGEKRKLICVGGKGLMSSRLYKSLMKDETRRTEGRLLAKTACSLFVSADDIIICDKGTNTGENLKEIAEVIGDKTAIVAVTQRLSLILYMSQKQQQPQLQLDYFVIWETVSETCCYMNGMRFASAKPILHYWAHVLRRWKNYSTEQNKFMLPVFGVDSEVEKRAERLQSKYVVKQRDYPLKSMVQMLPFVFDLLIHGKYAQQEYNIVVRQWRKELRQDFREYIIGKFTR